MAMKIIVFTCLLALQYQVASSQCLRQQFNRFIETPRLPRSIITQPRFNNPCPSQTIITDCTPSVCQNLADTLQLMIVCNALQSTGCGCNDCINAPVLSSGCANAVSPSFISPRAISPSVLSSNVISPSVISPNVISPFNAECISPVSVSNPFNRFLSLLS